MSYNLPVPAAEFRYEAENWVSYCIAGDPDSAPSLAEAATAGSQNGLPPNFRWAVHGDKVVLQADLHADAGQFTAAEARHRLQRLASFPVPAADQAALDENEVECALGQLGCQWKRVGSAWQTAISWPDGTRCELVAEATQLGVHVSSPVAVWEEELDVSCREALARFLGKANARLRFVRLVLDHRQARAESMALADRLDAELCDSVFGVAAAVQAVGREVRALLVPDLASAYLAVGDATLAATSPQEEPRE